MNTPVDVIAALKSHKPWSPTMQDKPQKARILDSVAVWLFGIAALGFALLAIAAVAFVYIWPGNSLLRVTGALLGISVMLLALAGLIVYLCSELIFVFNFGFGLEARAEKEITHDWDACKGLESCDLAARLKAIEWLNGKADLAKSRSALVYKIAPILFLPSILDFVGSHFLSHPSSPLGLFSEFIALCWFAIIGMLMGAIALELYASRLRYFVQLLKLTK